MIIASDQGDRGTFTHELREQVAALLPLEIRDLLLSTATLSAHDLRTIHTRLEYIWRSLKAMVPRWIVDGVDDPAWRCVSNGEATLLFADVTGFTPLTAQLETFGRIGNEYITTVLNRFFAAVVPIALAHGGDLLAFGGDAIMVAFDGLDHALLAVAAAWDMQQAIELLDFHDLGLPHPPRLQMKIGLASGPLVLASVGTGTRRAALPMGSVLDTADAMANATLPGGVRLDARAALHAAPVAHLALELDGSALLLGLRERPRLTVQRQPETATASITSLAERIVALARYLPRSIVEALGATPQVAPGDGEQRFVVSQFTHLSGLHALADVFWSSAPGVVARAADLALNRAIGLIEGYGGVLARNRHLQRRA